MDWSTVLPLAGLFIIGSSYLSRRMNRLGENVSKCVDRLEDNLSKRIDQLDI